MYGPVEVSTLLKQDIKLWIYNFTEQSPRR